MGNTGGKSQQNAVEDVDQMDCECPVCLQVLEKPVRTQCGHVFCQGCHHTNFSLNGGRCAVCRGTISNAEQRATDIEKWMMATKGNCRGCGTEVNFINMRAHTSTCSKYLEDYGPPPEASTLPQSTPASPGYMVPHRSTYTCPYCQERNCDEDCLIDHCFTFHYYDPRRVVCPICASMPWGLPNYYSRNFIGHLRLRHQVPYDYFVDYNQDEEIILQNVLLSTYQDFARIPNQ
ncbi:E3 ubiquitin-protein ligase RNF114 [Heptranchias perlo]|uniref:E3 ubiquitin-protein ligase RNF114 n=1 Tax=Heptranchias perlo TaxID=212740 RepID=UPI0035595733